MTRVTIRSIVDLVAAEYGLEARQILGASRGGEILRARHVAMYLAERHGHGLSDIGRALGDRDRTTVRSARERIKILRRHDAELAFELEAIERAIEDAERALPPEQPVVPAPADPLAVALRVLASPAGQIQVTLDEVIALARAFVAQRHPDPARAA